MLKQENPWRLSCRETMTMIQKPGIWKRIWDLMEARNIASPSYSLFITGSLISFPLPLLIINYAGGAPKAECVKVNPHTHTPQKQVRFLTLHGGFDTAHAAARANDRPAIKFQGLDVDTIFNISDYEEAAK